MTERATPDERRAFGKRLAEAREARGWTQKQLAAACGLSNGLAVSRWETGRHSPEGRAPWNLCRVFGYETFIRLWGDEPEDVPVVILDGQVDPGRILTGPPEQRTAAAAAIMRKLSDELADLPPANGRART